MRISRSPHNGGFHSSTGGGPLARPSAPVIASSPDCPSFAMVCLDSPPRTEVRGTITRDFASANLHPSGPEPKLFLSVANQRKITSGWLARILHHRPWFRG